MKTFMLVVKILVALAAIAGIIYVIYKYGDRIVAWVKKLRTTCFCRKSDCDDFEFDFDAAEDAAIAEQTDFEG